MLETAARAAWACSLSPASIAATVFLIAERMVERFAELRRLRRTFWRARFLADSECANSSSL